MVKCKSLKFVNHLIPLVLSGEKTTTWRINDEKGIIKGDILSLRDSQGVELAKARVTDVRKTQFKDLEDKDFAGHEDFKNSAEIYETYSKYYRTEVNPKTKLKVIKFRLINKGECHQAKFDS